MKLILICVLWLNFNVNAKKLCPGLCRCDIRRKTVFCNEKNFNSIPSAIPSDTKILHLQGNNIKTFYDSEKNLKQLKLLQKLDLHNNRIILFPKNLPSSLNALLLRKNEISHLPSEILAGLSNLRDLQLDHNNIHNSGISDTAFSKATALRHLTLAGNRLDSIPGNIPSGVKNLRLEYNKIKLISKSSLSSLTNLIHLDLSFNLIESIEPEALGSLANLKFLKLTGNRLTNIPKPLPPLLNKLSLSHNKIASVTADDGKGLTHLTRFDLSSNLLQNIGTNAFDGATELRELEINGNPWKCDCEIDYLRKWIVTTTSLINNVENLQCHSPLELKGNPIRNLKTKSCISPINITVVDVQTNKANVCLLRGKTNFVGLLGAKYNVTYKLTNYCYSSKLSVTNQVTMHSHRFNNSCFRFSGLNASSHYEICIVDLAQKTPPAAEICKTFVTTSMGATTLNTLPTPLTTPSAAKTKVVSAGEGQFLQSDTKLLPSWAVALTCMVIVIGIIAFITSYIRRYPRSLAKSSDWFRNHIEPSDNDVIVDAGSEFNVAMCPRAEAKSEAVPGPVYLCSKYDYPSNKHRAQAAIQSFETISCNFLAKDEYCEDHLTLKQSNNLARKKLAGTCVEFNV